MDEVAREAESLGIAIKAVEAITDSFDMFLRLESVKFQVPSYVINDFKDKAEKLVNYSLAQKDQRQDDIYLVQDDEPPAARYDNGMTSNIVLNKADPIERIEEVYEPVSRYSQSMSSSFKAKVSKFTRSQAGSRQSKTRKSANTQGLNQSQRKDTNEDAPPSPGLSSRASSRGGRFANVLVCSDKDDIGENFSDQIQDLKNIRKQRSSMINKIDLMREESQSRASVKMSRSGQKELNQINKDLSRAEFERKHKIIPLVLDELEVQQLGHEKEIQIQNMRKACVKKDRLLAFARKATLKRRNYMRAAEDTDDRLKSDNEREFKKNNQKEFHYIYDGPPIKVKRGVERVTAAQRKQKELQQQKSFNNFSNDSLSHTFSKMESVKLHEESPEEDLMSQRLADVKEATFKLKSLIDADHRFSKRQTDITVHKGSQMDDMKMKNGLVLRNAAGDVIKQGERIKRSRIQRQATSRQMMKTGGPVSSLDLLKPGGQRVGFNMTSRLDNDDGESLCDEIDILQQSTQWQTSRAAKTSKNTHDLVNIHTDKNIDRLIVDSKQEQKKMRKSWNHMRKGLIDSSATSFRFNSQLRSHRNNVHLHECSGDSQGQSRMQSRESVMQSTQQTFEKSKLSGTGGNRRSISLLSDRQFASTGFGSYPNTTTARTNRRNVIKSTSHFTKPDNNDKGRIVLPDIDKEKDPQRTKFSVNAV